ncbi:MAG TPA: hypothetical protein VE890_13160, partial [Thermoguttaceae bacterium]|nr:hypothetical protein [Thermoguttaceae bacterium]
MSVNEERPSPNGSLSRVPRSLALLLIVAVCAFTAGLVAADKRPAAPKNAVPKIDAAAMARMVQSFDKIEKLEEDWGWLRWMMNSKLDPDSEMTFGLVQVNAGHRNPMHIHPNCEEQLYVLSGACEHVLGGQVCTL